MSEYILNPYVTYEIKGETVFYYNHHFGLVTQSDIKSIEYFEKFREPKILENDVIESGTKEFIEQLINNFILLPVAEVQYLAKGFTQNSAVSIGVPVPISRLSDIEGPAFAFLGLPFDIGSKMGGARSGSTLVREAFQQYDKVLLEAMNNTTFPYLYDFDLKRGYNLTGMRVYDCGDVKHDFMDGAVGFRFKTEKLLRTLLQKDITPIILGGDHTVSYFALSGIAHMYPKFGLLQFDAHHDTYTNTFLQRNSLNHANFVSQALLFSQLDHVYHFGARTLDYMSSFTREQRASRISVYSSLELVKQQPSEIFQSLNVDLPYYLTIDIDVLDPLLVSETLTPVIGGVTFYQLLLLIDYLSLNFNIIGVDFVEVQPSPKANIAAKIVARLILLFILNRQSFRTLENI